VPGLDIAGQSTYCDETGGDYYDFLIVDEPVRGNVLVALGDVMGHGVAAALVMAGTRAVLRDRADATGGLAALMTRLNRMIASDLEGSRFMTMHLGVMDLQRRIYRWSSAGHDPPIIYDPASKTFDEPEGGSLPLGVMDSAEYEEHILGPLKPGQILFLGTDGVWEMPDAANQQFGKQRLREVIQSAADGSADQIAKAIRSALTAYRGQEKSVDDVTFVILKAMAVPQVKSERDVLEAANR
jgi:sigma-B regulation protein RsbU (phosphoserine phosphatase)